MSAASSHETLLRVAPLGQARPHLTLFVFQQTAGRVRAARVNRIPVFINVPDDAVLVDDERRAVREAVFFVQDAVFLRDPPFEVAEQRKSKSILLGENFVRGGTVHADPNHLGPGLLEIGDISLIRLELFRSTPGECQDIKRQHDVLLP